MANLKLILLGGGLLLGLALFSVIVARSRGGKDRASQTRTSLWSSCLGCSLLLIFLIAAAGAIVRAVNSVGWNQRAGSIEVIAAAEVELFGDYSLETGATAPGPDGLSRIVPYTPPTFPSNVTPAQIVETLFPGSSIVDVKTQGMTTAESPEGHWVGTSMGVVLRAPTGTLDSMVIFVRTIAEAPEAGARVAVVRARRGEERFIATESVGIEISDHGFLDRFLRLDDPPQLTLEVEVGPTPDAYLIEGSEPPYLLDTVPPR